MAYQIANTAGITRLRIGISGPGGQRAEIVFRAANPAAPLVAVTDEPATVTPVSQPAGIISGAEVDGSDAVDNTPGSEVVQ